MLTFMLNGCSSLFETDYASSKNDGLLPAHVLSDVEMRRSIGPYDKVDVSPLSRSAVDKNMAISTHTLPSQQPTQVTIQTQKPKIETQASLSVKPELSRPSHSSAAALSRSNVTGKWAIQEAGNPGCKVVLSSSPALDLYKASTNGCKGTDIRTVNSWDLRNGEVYLYSRGNVVARFKGKAPSLQGSLSKSGAPLVLSR
jgi:hypothetical protein